MATPFFPGWRILAVVDLLYMGIILSDYERFSRNLDRSGQVIADRGYAQT